MIKINSELPLCMLEKNETLNDFDFVLFHLYRRSPMYREYFQRIKRFTILDCSAYEFFINHETMVFADFAHTITELKPDYYILPDTLMDMDKTLEDSEKFLLQYRNEVWSGTGYHSEPMAVVQGNSIQDFVKCLYKYHEMGIRAIAIPFHNSFLKSYWTERYMNELYKIVNRWDDDVMYAAGRMKVIDDLRLMLQEFDYVHLLGSHCPYEKTWYKPYSFIKSMDTGYPVKNGYEGKTLADAKANVIIDDILYEELTPAQRELIAQNINHFKLL